MAKKDSNKKGTAVAITRTKSGKEVYKAKSSGDVLGYSKFHTSKKALNDHISRIKARGGKYGVKEKTINGKKGYALAYEF